MNLNDAIKLLRKRKLLVIAATVICAAAALGTSLATKPVYQTSAKLLVVAQTNPEGGINSAYQGALLSEQLVQSLTEVLKSRRTAERALARYPEPISRPMSGRELAARVQAEPIPETLVINLHVEDTDPRRAQRLTNNLARTFVADVPNLQSGSSLRVSLFEPALRPSIPVRPRTTVNVTLGLIVGLLLGLGAALAAEHLDTSVRTSEGLEAVTGAPVLGSIPALAAATLPLPVASDQGSASSEAFRKLRTNLSFLTVDREGICCAITSSTASEGKSTVAANLALAHAHAGKRVVLVDTDLRRPVVHEVFGLRQEVGTTSVLLDRVKLEDALQYPDPDGLLAVLASGPVPPNPSELLGSRRMAELITELRSRADVVLLDCAPTLPVTDPLVVARFTDGVLVVTRVKSTNRAQVQATVDACRKAGVKVLGAVLNGARQRDGGQAGYYQEYYYRPAEQDGRKSSGRSGRSGRNGKGGHGRRAERVHIGAASQSVPTTTAPTLAQEP
jgi:capsular exopolysaccharide synthesis family protein